MFENTGRFFDLKSIRGIYCGVFSDKNDLTNKEMIISLAKYLRFLKVPHKQSENGIFTSEEGLEKFVAFYKDFKVAGYYAGNEVKKILETKQNLNSAENKAILKPVYYRGKLYYLKKVIDELKGRYCRNSVSKFKETISIAALSKIEEADAEVDINREFYDYHDLEKLYYKFFDCSVSLDKKKMIKALILYFKYLNIPFKYNNDAIKILSNEASILINFFKRFNVNDFYSSEDVANILNVNRDTLYISKNKDVLKPIYYQGAFFYEKSIIDNLLHIKNDSITCTNLMRELNILTLSGLKSFIKEMQNEGHGIEIILREQSFWSKDLLVINYDEVVSHYNDIRSATQHFRNQFNTEEYYSFEDLKNIYKEVFRCKRLQKLDRILDSLKLHLESLNIKYYYYNNELFVKKEDIEIFEDLYSNFDPSSYYKFEDVNKLLGVSRVNLHKNSSVTKEVYYKNAYYYEKGAINYFIELKNSTMPFSELLKMSGMANENTLYGFIKKLQSKGVYAEIIKKEAHVILGNSYLVKGYENVIKYLKIKEKLENTNSSYDKFIIRIEDIEISNTKALKTLQYFKEFLVERHNTRKDFYKAITGYVFLNNFLSSELQKEVTSYNDIGISKFIKKYRRSSGYSITIERDFVLFLKFCKSRFPLCSLPNLRMLGNNAGKGNDTEDVSYTRDQWLSFGKYLFLNLENNSNVVSLAKSRGKAMIWAYCALHYVVAWRMSDIINIPHPNLNIIGFNSGRAFLDYLIDGGKFSHIMGESICYDVSMKIKAYGELSDKNSLLLKFVVDDTMLYYIGLLLAICEAHRQTVIGHRGRNSSTIITKDSDRRALKHFGKEYVEIFGEEGFGNKRATKTLMNFLREEGEKESPALGIYLPSVARPHSGILGIPSEVTANPYLMHGMQNNDNSLDLLTYNLMKRGVFSFAAYKILFVINNSFANISVSEQTQMIESLCLKPIQFERMSKAIIENKNKADQLIEKVIKGNKNMARKTLQNLFTCKSSAKHHSTSCLLKAVLSAVEENTISTLEFIQDKDEMWGEDCINPSSSSCFGCDFLIAEKYFLIELSKKITEVVEKYKSSQHERDRKRYFELNSKLKMLLKEAILILGIDRVRIYFTPQILNGMELIDKQL